VVAILALTLTLALGAWLATCTSGGNVRVVRLLAVGHGGWSNVVECSSGSVRKVRRVAEGVGVVR
jgi:hypothetical protein